MYFIFAKRFAEFIEQEDPDIILVWNRDTSPFSPSSVPVLGLVLGRRELELPQDVSRQ